MLKIVPAPDAPANPLVRRRLVAAFRAEVDRRVGDGDFARRAEVALALANEVVRAELTAAPEAVVASHGTEDALVDGEPPALDLPVSTAQRPARPSHGHPTPSQVFPASSGVIRDAPRPGGVFGAAVDRDRGAAPNRR